MKMTNSFAEVGTKMAVEQAVYSAKVVCGLDDSRLEDIPDNGRNDVWFFALTGSQKAIKEARIFINGYLTASRIEGHSKCLINLVK